MGPRVWGEGESVRVCVTFDNWHTVRRPSAGEAKVRGYKLPQSSRVRLGTACCHDSDQVDQLLEDSPSSFSRLFRLVSSLCHGSFRSVAAVGGMLANSTEYGSLHIVRVIDDACEKVPV